MFSALIIDADGKTPAVIQDMLAGFRFEFTVTENGPEAVNVARTVAPSLIFVRAELPLTSGFSVCNRLRRSEQTRSIPVIIYASSVSQEVFDQHSNLKTHADGYVKMPFDEAALHGLVRELIGKGGAAEGGAKAPTPAAEPPLEVTLRDAPRPSEPRPASGPTPASDAPRPSELRPASGPRERSSELSGEFARETTLTHDDDDEISMMRSSEPSGFRMQREVLEIRAALNAKKRELLALRDDIETRDRAVLDAKSQNRQLQTLASDLEGQLIGVQEQLISARESLEAMTRDRATAVKREEGLKIRLEGTLKKYKELEAELAEAQKSFELQQDRAATTLANTLGELTETQDRLARAESERDGLTTELMAARAEATDLSEQLADKRQEASRLEIALAELTQRSAEEQRLLREETEEALTELLHRTTEEKRLLKDQAEHALAELRESYESHVQEIKQRHAHQLAESENDRETQVLELEERHTDQLTELRERHARQSAEAKERHELEIGALRRQQDETLAALNDDAAAQLLALEEAKNGELAGQRAKHAAEIAALEQASAEMRAAYEGQIAAQAAETAAEQARLEGELADTRELAEHTIGRLNHTLDETRAQADERIDELMTSLATAREQAAEMIEELNHQLIETRQSMGGEIRRLGEALADLQAASQAESTAQREKIALLTEALSDTETRLGDTSDTLTARNHAGQRAQQALAIALKLLEEHTLAP